MKIVKASENDNIIKKNDNNLGLKSLANLQNTMYNTGHTHS